MENKCTVYFSGFNKSAQSEEYFKGLFSTYGKVVHLFTHNVKQYGMVEFEDHETARQVIKSLHNKPPLFLHMNFAHRKNTPDLNNSNMFGNNRNNNETRPGRRSNSSSHTPSLSGSLPEEDDIVIIKEKIYLDENNEFVDILTEPSTGEVYVPIRYAKNIRVLIKTVPKYKKNLLAEGYTVDDIANLDIVKHDSDEGSPLNNSHIGRRVTLNSNQSEGFKINIQNETNSSCSTENDGANNQKLRRPHYNKLNTTQNLNSSFNDSTESSDNFKENKPFNREKIVPLVKQEPTSSAPVKNVVRETASPAIQEAVVKPPLLPTPKSAPVIPVKYAPHVAEKCAPVIPVKSSPYVAEKSAPVIPVKSSPYVAAKSAPVIPVKSSPPVAAKSAPAIAVESPPVTTNSAPVIPAKLISYKTIELPKNEFTQVSIEFAISDTVGWVRMVEHEDIVDDMARIIMKETEIKPNKCKLQVGKMVLAKYEDTILLRAVILAVAPEILVRYIDYGEDCKLTAEDIQDISDKLAAIPAYSFCIKLAERAPFKMQNGLTMNVKPIRKEDDVTIVHVENGIYEKEESEIKPAKPAKSDKPVLDTLQDLLISKLEVQHIGFLELTLKLSPTQYVATFMPMELTDEVALLQTLAPKADPSFKPIIGDIVSAKNVDGWQRVYLLDTNEGKPKYTVAFIDYATIEKVDEILPLPENFLKYPIFSCVCLFDAGNEAAISKLNVPVDFEIKSIDKNIIHCDLTIDDVLICQLKVKPWNPKVEIPDSYKKSNMVTKPVESVLAAPKPDAIVAPKNSSEPVEEMVVNDGADVKLITESEGKLYVRTKQSATVFKKVNEYMATNSAKAPMLQEVPQVGQWVAAKYENDWFRASVLSINGKQASVWFLDYGDTASQPYFMLRTLDPEMTQQPASLIKITLKNFENVAFDKKCLDYLSKLNNEFLKAVKCGNVFELVTRSGIRVSEALIGLAKPPPLMATPVAFPAAQTKRIVQVPGDHEPKLFGKSILGHELPLGRTQILLQELKDPISGLICVCTNKPDILHRIQVDLLREITHYATKIAPTDAYMPAMDECVLVQNGGKWYRGVCAGEVDKFYTIFLLDYACAIEVGAIKLKRMPKEFAEEKALSMFAVVHGLPDDPSAAAIERLESLLQKNECYTVEVLQKNEEDCYIISFPDISRILKNENLIN